MIIKCKECQVEVSDSAVSCPNCGISFPGISDEDGQKIDKDSRYRAWLMVLAVLFFGPIIDLLYYIFIGDDQAAKGVFLTWWPYIVLGAILYIVSEFFRGISNWWNSRSEMVDLSPDLPLGNEGDMAIVETENGKVKYRYNEQGCESESLPYAITPESPDIDMGWVKVKDLADIEPVEGGVIKEGNPIKKLKAVAKCRIGERLGPGEAFHAANMIDEGQELNVFSFHGDWVRVSTWHDKGLYPEVLHTLMHFYNGKVARWVRMDDIIFDSGDSYCCTFHEYHEHVDNGIGTLYTGSDNSKWKDIGIIHSIHMGKQDKGDA